MLTEGFLTVETQGRGQRGRWHAALQGALARWGGLPATGGRARERGL